VLPFVILFVVGVLDIMVDVNGTTIIQTGIPEGLLGRVFGAFEGVLILATLQGLPVKDGDAVFAVHRDRTALAEVAESLVHAHPRGRSG
jgi:drug/metabolite transporter superfamily protein YnfA